MRRLYVLFAMAVLITSSAMAQATPESRIRQLLDQQTADWNRGDVEAFMKGYEDSPSTIFIGQSVQYGYARILERYRKQYASQAAMGKLAFTHLEIHLLDANYAVATGNFHLDRTPDGGGNADGIFSLIFRKDPDGWKIILDHTSRIG
jgi:ketosteroid isomerase-like protein